MAELAKILEKHKIQHYGFAELKTPLSMNFYEHWLSQGYHGDMTYLENHLEMKRDPQSLLPKAQSAIVFTHPYVTKQTSDFPLKHLKVAEYANQSDYHFWLQQKVNDLCRDLKDLYPNEEFLGFTDSSPVMERDLAYRAGLGWVGKNTCLIDRKQGSLFFIAEIYTSLPLDSQKPLSPDHCGKCTKCIESCPTDAILEDKTLDATKCIAYWTIESKTIPPESLRKNFQGWLFGCDICQTVCPWNEKIQTLSNNEPRREDLIQELKWLLNTSNKQLLKAFHGTPLTRAGGRGLKRNALIVIANLKLYELQKEVESYLNHEVLGELAQWTQTHLVATQPDPIA